MWFKLAALWGCTVSEAQQRCDAREFCEWLAYYRLEPWGEWRADLRMGKTCQAVAQYCGHVSTRAADFMPDFDGSSPDEMQNVEDMQTEFQIFAES